MSPNLPRPALTSNRSATPLHRELIVFRSVAEIPANFGPTVAAIGNFDGVHLGHQEILSGVVAEARSLGAQAVAVTFEPHPEHFLRPDQAPRLLTPLDERLRLLSFTGIDAVVVLPFDAALATLPARAFVLNILLAALDLRSLHEGGNFRFGHNAEAGMAELLEFAAEFGFGLHIHSPVRAHGMEVSSSAIRERIAAGDMTRARWMLGRPFEVRSTQARGRGIGTRLLVPTVNLAPYGGLLPAFGVYVTRLTVDGRSFQAVTNVGNRPTFGEASFAVESHILNFEPIEMDEDTPIELEFLLRLRGEIEWPSPEALKAQIFKDVAKARRFFRLAC
ncbi:MAG: bifunctional riboflavin kinase/FAD synthetase [Terracidiphilus sp.]